MKNTLHNLRLALAIIGQRPNFKFRAFQVGTLLFFLILIMFALSSCKTTCPAYHTIDKKSTLFSQQEAKLEVDSLVELSLK